VQNRVKPNFTQVISLLSDVPDYCKDVKREQNGLVNDKVDVILQSSVRI